MKGGQLTVFQLKVFQLKVGQLKVGQLKVGQLKVGLVTDVLSRVDLVKDVQSMVGLVMDVLSMVDLVKDGSSTRGDSSKTADSWMESVRWKDDSLNDSVMGGYHRHDSCRHCHDSYLRDLRHHHVHAVQLLRHTSTDTSEPDKVHKN